MPIRKRICRSGNAFADQETTLQIRKRLCKLGNDFPGWETNLSNGMARLPIGKRFCELGWLCCRPGNDFANSEIALRNGNAICGLGNGFANQHARHPNRQTTLLIGMALLLIGKSVCESAKLFSSFARVSSIACRRRHAFATQRQMDIKETRLRKATRKILGNS